jgi:heme exporter protein D
MIEVNAIIILIWIDFIKKGMHIFLVIQAYQIVIDAVINLVVYNVIQIIISLKMIERLVEQD